MPKLKTYTAELGGLPTGGPRASAEDFGAGAAAALADLGRQGQQIAERMLKEEEAADARRMLVGVAKLNAQYAQAQQEAIATGTDLDAMREKYMNDMAELRGLSTTRHGADTFDYQEATSTREFDVRSVQIKSARAGAQARVHAEEVAAAWGTQVFNDPSALPGMATKVDAFMANLPMLVSPEQRAEIKQELMFRLNGDAVRGLIQIDPEGTKRRLEAGEFNLKPGQLPQEVARAQAMIDANEQRRMSAARNAAWERGEKSAAKSDLYIKQIIKGQFDEREAVVDTDLEPAMREHLFKFNELWQRQRLGEGKMSNPTAVRDMLLRIYASEDDPRKVRNIQPLLAEVSAGRINMSDFRWLNAAIAEQRDPNNSPIGRQFYHTLRTVESAFFSDPRYKYRPFIAARISNLWSGYVLDQMNERREGNKDLRPLFDPGSPEYVLRPELMDRFVKEATQSPLAGPTPGQIFTRGNRTVEYIGPENGDVMDPANWREVPRKRDIDWAAQWRQETGGTLRPGQTQEEAIAEFRAQWTAATP